jgi:hypothetical protein
MWETNRGIDRTQWKDLETKDGRLAQHEGIPRIEVERRCRQTMRDD